MKFVKHINMELETQHGTHCLGIALAMDGTTNYVAILEVETKKTFVEELMIPKISASSSGTQMHYKCKAIDNDQEWNAAIACFQKAKVLDAPVLDKKVIDFWNAQERKKKRGRLYTPYNRWKFSRSQGVDNVPDDIKKVIEDFRKEHYAEDEGRPSILT